MGRRRRSRHCCPHSSPGDRKGKEQLEPLLPPAAKGAILELPTTFRLQGNGHGRPGGEGAAGNVAGPWSPRLWHWRQEGGEEQKPPLSFSTTDLTRAAAIGV